MKGNDKKTRVGGLMLEEERVADEEWEGLVLEREERVWGWLVLERESQGELG